MVYHTGPKIVTDGLVLCLDAADRNSYPGSGASWLDLSGNGYNGTLTNGPTFSSDNAGVFSFDGTDDHVNFGNILNSVLSGNDCKFTFSLWTRVDNISGTSHHLISKNGDSNFNENQRQLIFLHRNSGKLEFIYYGLNSATIYRVIRANNVTLEVSKWYNLVATYDGSIDTNNGLDRVVIYQNASVVSTYMEATAGSLVGLVSSSSRLSLGAMIGQNPSNTPKWLSTGLFGNVSIYNKVLSADEVRRNYNATKGRFGL